MVWILPSFRGLWLLLFSPTASSYYGVRLTSLSFSPETDDLSYEIFLNKGDNFTFTVGHFTVLGLPDVVKSTVANEVGHNIVSHIRSHFTLLVPYMSSVQQYVPPLTKERRKKRGIRRSKKQQTDDE